MEYPLFNGFDFDRRKADGKIIDVKTRYALRQIGKDPFEVLPDGWIEVMHESGMPIYLQRKTRIVRYCVIFADFVVMLEPLLNKSRCMDTHLGSPRLNIDCHHNVG